MSTSQVRRLFMVAAVMTAAAQVPTAALALKSDRDQPATVDAEEVDMDFKTGVRTYRGKVFIKQGSTEIYADKVVTEYVDDKLDKATAWGNPAVFKTLPDGQEEIVTGKGQRLEFDNANRVVTMYDNAVIEQHQNSVTGDVIAYNLTTEQLKIRGGSKIRKTSEGQEGSDESTGSGQRSKIVIQPKPKKAPVATE